MLGVGGQVEGGILGMVNVAKLATCEVARAVL